MLTSNRIGCFPRLFLPQCLHRCHMPNTFHNQFPVSSYVTPALWEHRCVTMLTHGGLAGPSVEPANRFYICSVSSHNILCQMKDRDTRANSRALACSAAPTRILLLHNPPLDTEVFVVFLPGRWRPSHKDQSVWLLPLARLFQLFSPNVHFPFIFSGLQRISIVFPRAVSVHKPNQWRWRAAAFINTVIAPWKCWVSRFLIPENTPRFSKAIPTDRKVRHSIKAKAHNQISQKCHLMMPNRKIELQASLQTCPAVVPQHHLTLDGLGRARLQSGCRAQVWNAESKRSWRTVSRNYRTFLISTRVKLLLNIWDAGETPPGLLMSLSRWSSCCTATFRVLF